MRYLSIVRHCHAERPAPGQADYDRGLDERGRDQADQLRAWALDDGALGRFGPTTALVSAARRTRETFARAFADTPFVAHVEHSDLIYNGKRDVSAEDLLIDLAALDPVTTSLLLVAHNPSVHELALTLLDDAPRALRERFATGTVVVLALPDDRPVGLARYELVEVYRPD